MGAPRIRLGGIFATAMLAGLMAVTHAAPVEAQAKKASVTSNKKVKSQARAAYKAGSKKFKAGDYAGALPSFQKADALYPGAAPKHKIAVCFDKLGKVPEAIAAYHAFIDSNPSEKYADRLSAAKKRLSELEATLPATVSVTVAPAGAAATITVDGNPAEGTELKLPAGEHTVAVSAEGYETATEVVNVRGGEKRDLPVTLAASAEAVPPPPPPPPPPPGGGEEEGGSSNVPAYVTLGVAGAGVILGTVFGIQALGSKSDFDDRIDAPDATSDELNDLADKTERSALIADMSFGVALTFGITGAVLLFSSGGDDDAAEQDASIKPELTPYAGPTGGGMAATWTF